MSLTPFVHHFFTDPFRHTRPKMRILFISKHYIEVFRWLLYVIIAHTYIFTKTRTTSSIRKIPPDIWIIGEFMGCCLKDNGYDFYRYCRDRNISEDVYLIANETGLLTETERASDKHIVQYGSFKHILLLVRSNVIIYTHTFRDVAPRQVFKLTRRNKLRVYVKHGIAGFKTSNAEYASTQYLHDVVASVSKREKSIIVSAGFKEQSVKIIGLPHHDYLRNRAQDVGIRQIAYMPTWRDWLSEDGFRSSPFCQQVEEFINDAALLSVLKRENIKLVVYLHVNMKDFSRHMSSSCESIKVMPFGSTTARDVIETSSVLITDYSSIAWEFLYLSKPVIFFQFDVDEYLAKRGSYLKFPNDLFGDVAYTQRQVVAAIQHLIVNDFLLDSRSLELREMYFDFFDKMNCQRLYNEIQQQSNP